MVIYLHGFASGPSSSKAAYIGRRLRARGVTFVAPDLNLPDFSTLTISRMLAQTSAAIDTARAPVVLIGSSLGGFVAVNMAVKHPAAVASLVLLAPALDFGSLSGAGSLGDLDEWQRRGELNVFHYGYGRIVPVHYGLYADARQYDAMRADVRMPTVVFQGTRDETVPPATVEAWCRTRPNVELHLLDDGHQLTSSLPAIWERIDRLVGG